MPASVPPCVTSMTSTSLSSCPPGPTSSRGRKHLGPLALPSLPRLRRSRRSQATALAIRNPLGVVGHPGVAQAAQHAVHVSPQARWFPEPVNARGAGKAVDPRRRSGRVRQRRAIRARCTAPSTVYRPSLLGRSPLARRTPCPCHPRARCRRQRDGTCRRAARVARVAAARRGPPPSQDAVPCPGAPKARS